MTHNEFIECDICNTIINLRIQLGYYNIKFHIGCPVCKTAITGGFNLDSKTNRGLTLVNAIRNNQYEPRGDFYSVELSAEFPTMKMRIRNMDKIDFTPFMQNIDILGDENDSFSLIRDAMEFANYKKEDWNELHSYYNLLWNDKKDILLPKANDMLRAHDNIPLIKIQHELDIVILLHQVFITYTGISRIFSDEILCDFINKQRLIFKHSKAYLDVLDYFTTIELDTNVIEKKGFELINLFKEIYPQLIPVITLRKSNQLKNIDLDVFGIMTTNYESLSKFYANSYEWILDNSDVLVLLNNINHRGNISTFSGNRNINDLQKSGKFQKTKFLNPKEEFSKPLTSLNNRIRNAIQHYDHEINYTNQLMDCQHFNGQFL